MNRYQRYFLASIPLLIFGALVYYFSEIFTYIVLAWVLSMVGGPLKVKLSKYIGNTFAAIVTLFTFTVIFVAILSLFIPPIIQQARNFTNIDYESITSSLEKPLEDWNLWLVDRGLMPPELAVDSLSNKNPQNYGEKISQTSMRIDTLYSQDSSHQDITIFLTINETQIDNANKNDLEVRDTDVFFERLRKNVIKFLDPSSITEIFGSIVGFVGNILITTMSVFFIAFFFLKEHGLFSNSVRTLVPSEYEEQSIKAIDQIAQLLIRYFIGVAVQVTVITVFMTATLSIVGFKNALLLSFFAALMNLIPYIGPFLGAGFAIIIVTSSNLDVDFYTVLAPKLIQVIGIFWVMQILDNYILHPKIFSQSVKAHPLEIFIVVLIGAKLSGILGMVLAIPAYTVLRVIAKVFLSEFKVVQRITREL